MDNKLFDTRLIVANAIDRILHDAQIVPVMKGEVFGEHIATLIKEHHLKEINDFTINKLFAIADDLFDAMNHGAVFVEGYTFQTLEEELQQAIRLVQNGIELQSGPDDYYSRVIRSR